MAGTVIKHRYLLHFLSIMSFCIFLVQLVGSALALEQRPIAFIHANLIPMTTEIVLTDQTVIVEGKLISNVGPSNKTEIPPNARVINCRNTFLMPGLADMHMHLRYDWMSEAWPVSPLKLYLANGVTTIRCFGPRGKTGRYGLKWSKEIELGRLDGPSILTCGPMLRGHFNKDPEHIIIKQKYQGFDFIKIYSFVTKEEYHAIMATAKKLKFYTAGHIPFQVGLEGVIAKEMNEIAHIEEFLWEFSDLDRRRYFESEGEWLGYAIKAAFNRFEPYLKQSLQEQEQQLEALVSEMVKKYKDRLVPVCTTLVVDDIIIQKLFTPDSIIYKVLCWFPRSPWEPAKLCRCLILLCDRFCFYYKSIEEKQIISYEKPDRIFIGKYNQAFEGERNKPQPLKCNRELPRRN